MSPMMQEMLVNDVVPRLRKAVRAIPKTGCEDDDEIVQDATLMAARMMDSAEKAGRHFTAGNIAYYAERAARSGRRSHYSGRSDVMSPGCLLDGRARTDSLDVEIEADDLEIGSLYDVLTSFSYSGGETDPSEEAARNLDWQAFVDAHPIRHGVALQVLAEGGTMREAGIRCGLRDAAASLLKRRIAGDLIAFFGEDLIDRLLRGEAPRWESNLRATRERHACRSGYPTVPHVVPTR